MAKTKFIIDLSNEQRKTLENIIDTSNDMHSVIRAKVLYLSDIHHEPNLSIPQIIKETGISRQTIVKIRNNYCQDGFESSLHEKSKSSSKKVRCNNEELIEKIKELIQLPAPNDKRWTVRSLSEACVEQGYIDRISPATMMRLLKKNNITV